MKIEVSIGDAVDRYCILEIKHEMISDTEKLKEIEKELVALEECEQYIERYPLFYGLLKQINLIMWHDTEKIIHAVNAPSFYDNYCALYDNNKKRFRVKRIFNMLCDSNIKEQKSHKETCCMIVASQYTIDQYPAKIYNLATEYDLLFFDREVEISTFNLPNIRKLDSFQIIDLEQYSPK